MVPVSIIFRNPLGGLRAELTYVLHPVCTRSFKTGEGSAGGFCLVKVVTPLLLPGSKRVTHFCPWLL